MSFLKTFLLLITVFIAISAKAQDAPYNPYQSIGKKARVLTLSNGKYIEFFDTDTVQRIGSILYNTRLKLIVVLLDSDSTFEQFSDNSSASRWYSIDPLAHTMKNNSISPYVFVKDNPIVLIDPDGRDWFYYQAQGEKKKTWHWQEGDKATYLNKKGKEVTTTKGYDYLVTYKMGGKNSEGATTGTMTVYNQNKAVLTVTKAVTGNDNFAGMGTIPKGNYLMNLNKRDANGPGRLVPDGAGSYKPEPYDGIQKIPNNAKFEYGGQMFTMNPTVTDAYGNGRIRLNQTDANGDAVPMYEQTAGYYLHGKQAAHNWTHGCICDKSEAVFNYFWSGAGKDARGYVPVSVE